MGAELTLTTWNVNSIRMRLDHVLTYLADHEPDIMCLQETKVEDRLFPKGPFMELGYTVTIHGGKALCGVATLTREAPSEVHRGFRDGDADKHPRILNTVVGGVRVYNLYVPNGTQLGSEAFAYKLAWLGRLREELDAHCNAGEAVAVVGDFNIAADDRDVWDPESTRGRLLYTDEELAAMENLVGFGFEDCFRKHNEAGGHYTWFDYRTNGFARNQGLRIDKIFATPSLAARSIEVIHDAEPRGWDVPSDHCPVTGRFSAG